MAKGGKNGKTLRLGRTPTATSHMERLAKVDNRASEKLRSLLSLLQHAHHTGKSVKQLKESRDDTEKKIGRILSEHGFKDEAIVATQTIHGPTKSSPPSTVLVVYQDVDADPAIDRAIVWIDVLVAGKSLLLSRAR